MKGIKTKPIDVSDRQRGRIEKKGMIEFQTAQQSWMDKLSKEGHGGDWGPEMYLDDGPIIYASAADTTKKIGMMEAMNNVIKSKSIFILPTTASVKLNPIDSEPATRTLDAVERFEMQNLMTELYPDMSKISMAKRIQERGPFRSSFEAQSGKATPHGASSKITKEVSKKMRSQILGIQPTRSERLSARQTKEMRKKITGRIYRKYEEFLKKKYPDGTITPEMLRKGAKDIGASEAALLDSILVGSHQYIDASERTRSDFKRMMIAYNQARKNNTPFMKKILPKIKGAFEQMEVFEGFDTKFLNALSPTAESITEPSVIHYIFDIESEAKLMPGDFFDKFFMRALTGEPAPGEKLSVSDPSFVRDERNKAANRFMAVFGHNTMYAAKSLLDASQRAFMSDKGIMDAGFYIKKTDMSNFEPATRTSAALDKAVDSRKKGKPINILFGMDEGFAPMDKQSLMRDLVKRGLAFPIGGGFSAKEDWLKRKPESPVLGGGIGAQIRDFTPVDNLLDVVGYGKQDELDKYQEELAKWKREGRALKKQKNLSQFYLVPVFSSGFSKKPKGWDSRWVVPTFQILEEYADVLTSRGDKPSALELLYLIATRAKALYDYELSEAETMLLYTMLDPNDPKKTKRGRVKRNPPVNILPGAGIKSSSLGDPFDEERAKMVFEYLTRVITAKNKTDEDGKVVRKTVDKSGGIAPKSKSMEFVKSEQAKGKVLRNMNFDNGKKLHEQLEAKGYEWTGKKWQKKSTATVVAEKKKEIKKTEATIKEINEAEEEGDSETVDVLVETLTETNEEKPDPIENESYGTQDTITPEDAKQLNDISTQFHSKIKQIVLEKTPPNGNDPGDFDDFASLYASDIKAQPHVGDDLDSFLRVFYDAYNEPSWIFHDRHKSSWEGTSYEEFSQAIEGLETILKNATTAYAARLIKEQKSEKIDLDELADEMREETKTEANIDEIHPIREKIEMDKMMDELVGPFDPDADHNWNRNPRPESVYQAKSLEQAKYLQSNVASEHGMQYVIMKKGKRYIVVSQTMVQEAGKKGYKAVASANKGFSPAFIEKMMRGKVKSNPITAECQKCGHKQKMKSLNDKCEKCGHGKFKKGEYTKRAKSSPKLKCTYKKTKRSKPCGSEVKLMKNGRIYKCHDCGAKYEMR